LIQEGGGGEMDYITLLNLALCAIILALGIRRYAQSGVKAFVLIGLGFLMFGISHIATLTGMTADYRTVLVFVRAAGYILVILGMLL
jgi:hypothetical protein